MTKQDRVMADLCKAVREYNAMRGFKREGSLILEYDGENIAVLRVRDERTLLFGMAELKKVNYARGCNQILNLTKRIRKEGERL